MESCYLASLLGKYGYTILDIKDIPQNGVPEQHFVYVDGHHQELSAYGHVDLITGIRNTPETKVTILPSDVFLP